MTNGPAYVADSFFMASAWTLDNCDEQWRSVGVVAVRTLQKNSSWDTRHPQNVGIPRDL